MSVELLLENSIATSILSTTDQDSIISAQILRCLIEETGLSHLPPQPLVHITLSLSLQWAMSKFKLPSHRDTRELNNQYKLRKRSEVWAQKRLNEILPISLGVLMVLFNFPSWFWLLGVLGRATKNRKDLPGPAKELNFYCIERGPNQAADGEILTILLFWVTECHILLGIDFWVPVTEWLDLQLESLCCATWVMQGLWWTGTETVYRASLEFPRLC